jgi:outer membrane immunogenic protein
MHDALKNAACEHHWQFGWNQGLKMKKLFVLAVSILAASVTVNAAASAADMATKAPIEIAGPSWTGFYVSGGGAWTADTTTVDQNTGQCVGCVVQVQGGKGWLGRVGIGYDYQFTSLLVAGLFGDYDFASLKGTIQDQNAGFTGEIKQNSAWALGARVGWLITPGVLGYANLFQRPYGHY